MELTQIEINIKDIQTYHTQLFTHARLIITTQKDEQILKLFVSVLMR